MLLKELSLPITIAEDDERFIAIQASFKPKLRQKSKELLIEEELARRKAIKTNLANEGLEAKRKEEEVLERKRKAEEEKTWEGACVIIVFFLYFLPTLGG